MSDQYDASTDPLALLSIMIVIEVLGIGLVLWIGCTVRQENKNLDAKIEKLFKEYIDKRASVLKKIKQGDDPASVATASKSGRKRQDDNLRKRKQSRRNSSTSDANSSEHDSMARNQERAPAINEILQSKNAREQLLRASKSVQKTLKPSLKTADNPYPTPTQATPEDTTKLSNVTFVSSPFQPSNMGKTTSDVGMDVPRGGMSEKDVSGEMSTDLDLANSRSALHSKGEFTQLSQSSPESAEKVKPKSDQKAE